MTKRKKLYRSQEDRVIFGVAGGLADYFDVDPLVVRLLFVALFFGGGSGLLIYIICALIIPSEKGAVKSSDKGSDKLDEFFDDLGKKFDNLGKEKQGQDWRFIIGLIVVFLGVSSLLSHILPFKLSDILWPVIIVVIGLVILFKK